MLVTFTSPTKPHAASNDPAGVRIETIVSNSDSSAFSTNTSARSDKLACVA